MRNFINVWECVVDAVLYVNRLWQIKSLRVASNNKDAILHSAICQFIFFEKYFE